MYFPELCTSAILCYGYVLRLYDLVEHICNEMIQFSKSNPLPVYYQLKEALRKQIESGDLKLHERLSSERELEESYEISRMTTRRALSELEAEGYIYRH